MRVAIYVHESSYWTTVATKRSWRGPIPETFIHASYIENLGNLIILDYLTHVWLRLAGEYQQQGLVYYHDSLIPMVFEVHQTSFRILNVILAPHITFLRVPVSCSATMCSRCEGEVQG